MALVKVRAHDMCSIFPLFLKRFTSNIPLRNLKVLLSVTLVFFHFLCCLIGRFICKEYLFVLSFWINVIPINFYFP